MDANEDKEMGNVITESIENTDTPVTITLTLEQAIVTKIALNLVGEEGLIPPDYADAAINAMLRIEAAIEGEGLRRDLNGEARGKE